MVEVGGRPILWHIMKHYSTYGFTDFGIALGYRGEVVKRYMIEYSALHSDLTVETRSGRVETTGNGRADDWTVALVDTGLDTATGGRIKRMAPYVGGETFMLTWGDGLSTVDSRPAARVPPRARQARDRHGRPAAGAVRAPPPRRRHRLPVLREAAGRGGLDQRCLLRARARRLRLRRRATRREWEREPLEQLARDGQLMAYRHDGFWQCMDTVRDKQLLEELWASGAPPWKLWT